MLRGFLIAILFVGVLSTPAPAGTRQTHWSWGTVTYTPPTWPVALPGDIWGPAATPTGTYPGVVMVHGGYETGTRSWNTNMSKWLADNGFVVLNIDYRLAPAWVYPDPEKDIIAATKWLAKQTYVAGPVTVFGSSSGAVMAEEIGTYFKAPVKKIVAWSGQGDFDETNDTVNTHLGCPGVGPSQCPQLYEYAEPITHVSPTNLPMYIAHSKGDTHIAAWTDEVFVSALQGAGVAVTFYEPSGNLHGVDFFGDDTAKSQTLAFLTS